MLLKSREKSFELVQFEALRGRIVFSEEQERLYKYVTAGFMGECLCDEMAESVAERVIQLRDLLLASGGRTCQVDSLLVVAGKVYLLEIKNWEGSFEIVDGRFVGLSACPLAQLQRSKTILEHLLRRYGFHVEVEARLLFINPKISLYGLTRQEPVLLRHQVEPYFGSVGEGSFWDQWDRKIGEFLLQQHVPENRFAKPVLYDPGTVQCGVMCAACRVRMRPYDLLRLECPTCGTKELKRECLGRTKAEFEALFANKPCSRHALHIWCDGLISRRMIYSQKVQESRF